MLNFRCNSQSSQDTSQLSENLENFSHNFVCLDLKLLIIKLKIRPKRKQPSNISIKILYTFWYKIQWANILKIRYIDDMAISNIVTQTDYIFRFSVSTNQRWEQWSGEPIGGQSLACLCRLVLYWQNQTGSLFSPIGWCCYASSLIA